MSHLKDITTERESQQGFEISESSDSIHIVIKKDNMKKINSLKQQLEAKEKTMIELEKTLEKMEFSAPNILNALKTDCDENGYKIELICYASNPNTTELTLKLVEGAYVDNIDNDNDGKDDEKKEEEKWMDINIGINPVDSNKFSSTISNIFDFNRIYKFKIIAQIRNPINMKFKSNIISIMVSDELDRSKERKIPLQINAHNGHWENDDTYKPQQVLSRDTNYYASAQNVVQNDWIIFEITEDECIYYPTRIQVVGYNENVSLKDVKLSIGDHEEKEWIPCHEDVLTARKQTEIQTFEINICDNPVHSCQIMKKCYKNFKLEILNNYGDNRYIGFREFIMYGVKAEMNRNKEIISLNNIH